MMTVPMDSSSAPSSRELAESLLRKNIEIENGLRRSQQSKVPSDPNAWVQMRENYEAIILQDHEFTEKHEIELKLWQLHYKRIEEYRHRISVATSAGSNASPGVKGLARPDSIKKIRAGIKAFLTGATGFYHDLILKIRTKFGLPLTYLNDGSDIVTKDERRSVMIQKGLVSCHRCLIYLGDLSRYKGLYGDGDGDSVSRDYAAASSYYTQAASLCPTNGNPHHQLAILASYSGNELLTVYRYFRSLAAETPFSTARDNLILVFERNRQSFSQLSSNVNAASARVPATRSSGRGRGRGDTRLLAKDNKTETTIKKDLNASELFKTFSTRFVRLNGVLFTRTSLETFEEILSSVTSDLHSLLSSGPEEKFNFGLDTAENALAILRLMAILIFTVHNVKRESQNQSYAEILQRTVLLQNAFTAAFEFAGSIIKRCMELHDISSSSLLPAILVFLEWLASHPDIASGSDVDKKQPDARVVFWNQCVLFLNKLIDTGLASAAGDVDETCFYNMNQYDEEETGNRLALMEDFELRGFLPLAPAQLILDFSRKNSYENDGSMKDRRSRVERIFSAGRALMDIVKVGHQKMFIDPKSKKFVLDIEPPFDSRVNFDFSSDPDSLLEEESQIESLAGVGVTETNTPNFGVLQTNPHLQTKGEEEEEEEEIVFKPTVSEKHINKVSSVSAVRDIINPVQVSFSGMLAPHNPQLPASFNNFQMPIDLNASSNSHIVARNVSEQPVQNMNSDTSNRFMKQETFLSDGLTNMNIMENGLVQKRMLHEGVTNSYNIAVTTSVFSSPVSIGTTNMGSYPVKVTPAVLPSMIDSAVTASGVTSDGLLMHFPSALPASRKNPVGRPGRHVGPPPGFSHVVSKQQNEVIPNAVSNNQMGLDDYSWLDGYRSSSTKDKITENSINQSSLGGYPQIVSSNIAFTSASSFPFPGKQVSNVQAQVPNEQSWKDFQLFEQLNPYAQKRIQQANSEQTLFPEQNQAQSLWSGRFFV